MDPKVSPSAPSAGGEEKSGMDNQPPPYQNNYGADCLLPQGVFPNQSGYPPGQPHEAPYGQPYQVPYQGMYAGQPIVVAQPTMYVTSGPLAQPLPDYLGYSIFTLLCCCLPIGIAALIYSINTRDANMSGNRPQAEKSSHLARILNHTALGLGIVAIVVSIVIVVITTISAS
ncbi:interferon-induced transmembrane protein 3-like [Electrophorus electricus]|uniref:interferon-induced transmembrane protein 3-like n=1 Tax=Electrophorus electricus TaxID=8005 RepID=UPI0015D00D15|nr:interferon-induced transmembrane protein 3-like [Electrophorus electricus]